MEACVDCIESAVEAHAGGAVRLELCSALKCGGLTPTPGLLRSVKKLVDIPVYVMLRNRDGDFNYTDADLEVMKSDAEDLTANGADGFVFGALKQDGSVDVRACKFISNVCRSFPMTFHRAIDVSQNVTESLESIISLGFKRVLTSGGFKTALEGSKKVKEMVDAYSERISIMPGAGITTSNLEKVLRETGAREFHASARQDVPSTMTYTNPSVGMSSDLCDEYSRKICSRDVVQAMVQIFQQYNSSFNSLGK